MIDLVKELIKEPESYKRYILFFLKLLISIIISHNLFIAFFGPYNPILMNDPNYWSDLYVFLTNGDILIVLGVFFFVQYFVFNLIPVIMFLLLTVIVKAFSPNKINIENDSFLKFIIKYFKILNYEESNNGVPSLGRNFYLIKKLIDENDKNDLHDQVLEIRYTSLFEIFKIFVAFSLMYFFILDQYHNKVINVVIIITSICLVYVLISIEYLFSVIENSYDNISDQLKFIEQVNVTSKYFNENFSMLPVRNEYLNFKQLIYEIGIKDQTIIIVNYLKGNKIVGILNQLNKENPKSTILLIVNKKMNKSLLMQLELSLVEVIYFESETKFKERIETYFNNNLKSPVYS